MSYNPTYQINADDWKIVIAILQKYLPLAKVRIFGSRVNKTATATSDLDGCVGNGAPVSLYIISNIRDELAESNIPYKVDLIDYHAVSPQFQAIIDGL